jgi:drug/metabolite transporter (DMT)-like permease
MGRAPSHGDTILTPRARIALAVVAGVAAALIYAGQFVTSRWSLQRTLTPWDLAAIRFAVAGPLLLPVLLRHGLPTAAGIGWGRATVLAIAAGAPFTLAVYAGLTFAPAGHGAVIVPGATPVVSTLLVWLWHGARPSATRLAGVVTIVLGLVLVSWQDFWGVGHGGLVWIGDLFFTAAALVWGVFPALTRRWQVDPLRGAAVVWTLALAYLPIYVLVFGVRFLHAPPGEIVLQGLYQGVGVAIVALVLYAWAIRVLGPSHGSLFMPLVPVLGVLLAVPTLGEIPTAVQLAGMVAVSAGMALAARSGP